MRRYYKKTIIYSEEECSIGNGVLTRGEFTKIEDITDEKEELIKEYGKF